MKYIITQILIVMFFTASLNAQVESEEKPLFEFGISNLEETFAMMDGLDNELMKSDDNRVVIRLYGGSESCFLCNYRKGSLLTSMLKTRKRQIDKYSIQYCNSNEELRTAVYVMPARDTFPFCKEKLNIPTKTLKFQSVNFEFENNNISPLENSIFDPVGAADGEYSQKALLVIKHFLEEYPKGKIYVIAYLGANTEYYDDNETELKTFKRNLDKKSIAKEILSNAKTEMIRNGINPKQIETIEGGYLDLKKKLEFWFVPEGGDIPTPKPDYVPNKKQK